MWLRPWQHRETIYSSTIGGEASPYSTRRPYSIFSCPQLYENAWIAGIEVLKTKSMGYGEFEGILFYFSDASLLERTIESWLRYIECAKVVLRQLRYTRLQMQSVLLL